MRTFSKVALCIGFAITCSSCSGGSGSPINSMPNQPPTTDSMPRQSSLTNLLTRPRYSATVLPATFEYSGSLSAMQQNGAVPGQVGNQAAVYRNGHVTLLGSYKGFDTMATSVNGHGDAVGWAENPNGQQVLALYFSRGHITVLQGTDGNVYYKPSSINDSDQIVGTCGLPVGSGQLFADLCTFSLTGPAHDLGKSGTMSNINARGKFVANLLRGEQSFAALGTGTTVSDIFAPRQYNGNPLGNEASWINNLGDIVGATTPVTAPKTFTPYIIKSGHLSLINMPGHANGVATGINDSDQVVGYIGYFTGAFYWQSGTFYELNSLVDGPALHLTYALGIADNGQILAANTEHLYILCPR